MALLRSILLLSTWSFAATQAGAIPSRGEHVSAVFPRASGCNPVLILDGASEDRVNTPNKAFTIKSSCNKLDTKNHAVFLQNNQGIEPLAQLGSPVSGTTITPDGITITGGLGAGSKTITVAALDEHGQPMFNKFLLRFGAGSGSVKAAQSSTSSSSSTITSLTKKAACANCASCSTCPSNPICQPTCRNPPAKSCDWYQTCAEGTMKCGSDGYPLHYGLRMCRRFEADLGAFTQQGQTWVWAVMNCLQKALIEPVGKCGATCASVNKAAFDSHPVCYLKGGVCDLPVRDMVQLVITINTDIFAGPALDQIMKTVLGCAKHYISDLGRLIEEKKKEPFHPGKIAMIFFLEGLKKWFETHGPN